jgi:hypothetical protein
MSEHQLANKSILQQVGVKYYVCHACMVVARKIYSIEFTK